MAAKNKKSRPSVKRDDVYEALREDGASKEKAARIANAEADPQRSPGRKGGKQSRYEDWSKEELYAKAQEIGLQGRSSMKKGELIDALRNH